jgi:hypothetical protein
MKMKNKNDLESTIPSPSSKTSYPSCQQSAKLLLPKQVSCHGLQLPSKKDKEKREDDSLAQNRQYAAELLSIILQGPETGHEARLAFCKNSGMNSCLKVLSTYRKRDPSGAEELEYMENVFDCVCSALSEPENKTQFLQEEGVELMVIMMKDKMLSRNRAIKVLDHALTGDAGTAACERFVEVLGLKSLFSVFMNKVRFAAVHTEI